MGSCVEKMSRTRLVGARLEAGSTFYTACLALAERPVSFRPIRVRPHRPVLQGWLWRGDYSEWRAAAIIQSPLFELSALLGFPRPAWRPRQPKTRADKEGGCPLKERPCKPGDPCSAHVAASANQRGSLRKQMPSCTRSCRRAPALIPNRLVQAAHQTARGPLPFGMSRRHMFWPTIASKEGARGYDAIEGMTRTYDAGKRTSHSACSQ